MEQCYFDGVFSKASGKNKIIESEDSGEETEKIKKKSLLQFKFICYQCGTNTREKSIL